MHRPFNLVRHGRPWPNDCTSPLFTTFAPTAPEPPSTPLTFNVDATLGWQTTSLEVTTGQQSTTTRRAGGLSVPPRGGRLLEEPPEGGKPKTLQNLSFQYNP